MAARLHRPQRIICDLNLGAGGSGYELARRLRADRVTANAIIVAMTGTGRMPESARPRRASRGSTGWW
jgi:CheY-like chemotaxis protein